MEAVLKEVSVLEFEKDSLLVDFMHANLSTGSLGECRCCGSVWVLFDDVRVFFRRTAACAIIDAKLLGSTEARRNRAGYRDG